MLHCLNVYPTRIYGNRHVVIKKSNGTFLFFVALYILNILWSTINMLITFVLFLVLEYHFCNALLELSCHSVRGLTLRTTLLCTLPRLSDATKLKCNLIHIQIEAIQKKPSCQFRTRSLRRKLNQRRKFWKLKTLILFSSAIISNFSWL